MTSPQTCQHLDEEAAIQAVEDGGQPIWLDIRVTDQAAARRLLQDRLKFHELAVEDALSSGERPDLQEFPDFLFMGVPALTDPKAHQDPESAFTEVGFFLKDQALITVSTARVPAIDTWFARWSDHPGRLGRPVNLLHAIVDGIVDDYFVGLEQLEDDIETLSDEIFSGDVTQIRHVLALKRRMLTMRRTIIPVRDVLNALLRRDIDLVPDDARPYFQDVYDHVIRVSELLDVNRETLTGLLDVHLSTVSNNLNEVMKKMTVIATVLMSMALVTGVYGMNFKYMPELDWRLGYPYAIGLMLAVGALIVWLFRRFKWL